MLRKTMIAAVGVAAGLGSAITAAPASAAPADPQVVDFSIGAQTNDVTINAVCAEASQYNNGSNHIFLPSITRNGANLGCTLTNGNNTNGVFKLQDALRLCHHHSEVASDGKFGPKTEAALRAVTGSGVYSGNYPQINWPIYNSNNDFTGSCANL